MGAAPESVVSVSLDVLGTEGFAILAAAADSTLVGALGGSTLEGGIKRRRVPRLGVQSQRSTKSRWVSLTPGVSVRYP